MNEENDTPTIKITDRRHFDRKGEKRPDADVSPEPPETPTAIPESPPASPGIRSGPQAGEGSGGPARPAETAGQPSSRPDSGGKGPRSAATTDLSDIASGISSSFSLLIARLAQETEIYLGLVPYPGKETAEPDLEAARAMIDVLSMLQEKTRGNLDEQESHLLENLLYTYRLEFVRRRSGGGER